MTAVTGGPTYAALPTALFVDPTGTVLYSLSHYYQQGYVARGPIDAATGAVGLLYQGFGQAAGLPPNTLALEPGGHFMYMTSLAPNGTGLVNYFATDSSARPYTATYTTPTPLTSSASDPSGKFLYLVNANGDALPYTIDSATGALTPGVITPAAFAPGQPILMTNQ
jgi:hypothetical protein